MADIARILTEVLLETKAAIAAWNQFSQAGKTAFQQIAAQAKAASASASASLRQIGASMQEVGRGIIGMGKDIRRVGQQISIYIGVPLLGLARKAITEFKKLHEETGTGTQLKLVRENEKAIADLNEQFAELGQLLIPFATQLTQALSDALKWFNSLDEETKGWITTLGLVAAAAGPVLFAISGIVSGIGGLITIFGFLAPALSVLAPAAVLLTNALGFLIGILWELGAAVAAAVGWPVLLAAALGAAAVLVYTYWDEIKAYAAAAITWVAEKLQSAWSAAINWLSQAWAEFMQGVASAIDQILPSLDDLIARAKSAWEWLKKAFSVQPPSTTGGGGGHAAGGSVPGKGGGDIVPAWLTPGEFVHRTAAVRKYGTGFMNAVNALRVPTAVARGYARGGFVGRPGYAYARGGLVGGRAGDVERGFTLVIDGNTFAGLRAPADTANELLRFSRERQLRSTGRAPSWFR